MHQGVVWERLQRSFKHIFYAILGKLRLFDESLFTVCCIFEQSLNACLLVPATAGRTELGVVTLNQLLLGKAGFTLLSLANGDFDHRQRYAWAHVYSDAIWSRWPKKFVPSLNSRTKWLSLSNGDLKTGGNIWTLERTIPRGYYPLTPVVKLNLGSDAVAGSAEVRTACENLICPVVKLARDFPVSNSEKNSVLSKLNFLQYRHSNSFWLRKRLHKQFLRIRMLVQKRK